MNSKHKDKKKFKYLSKFKCIGILTGLLNKKAILIKNILVMGINTSKSALILIKKDWLIKVKL